MKIALVSDIHGNLWALDAVLAHAAAQGVDAVWNLGDILSGPLAAAATADRLIALDLVTIAGNHERQLLACEREPAGLPSDTHAFSETTAAHRTWLRGLPATARPRPDVLLCHGTPGSDVAPLVETHEPGRGLRLATRAEAAARIGAAAPARLIACGHTHLPRVVHAGDDCVVVNPGSVGLQAYDYDEAGGAYYVDNGTPDASYAIIEERDGARRWQASLHRVPYDHEAAAAMAARNGRPEWAHALRTGYALRA
jgi:predicted phosphodiesterase